MNDERSRAAEPRAGRQRRGIHRRQAAARPLRAGAAAGALILALVLASAPASATATFAQRLQGVDAAVQAHLQQQGGEAAAFPADLRRIAWLPLRPNARPDALVVLKPRRDECAAAARTPRPCRALLLLAGDEARYAVAAELTLMVQPLVLLLDGQGVIDELFHTRDRGEPARFNGYRLAEGGFVPAAAPAGWDRLAQRPSIVVDDRNLPLLADQRYAAQHFDNAGARLAPFRIHFDGIQDHRQHDQTFIDRAGALVNGLAADLAQVVRRLAWPQTLETRIWSCRDWMVPRRFWEVENRRLGRIGLCADPLVFAQAAGLARDEAEVLGAARYRLLQEIGVAWVLRIAPLSHDERERLKAPAAAAQLQRIGQAAGLAIGQALGLQTPEQARQAQALWQRIADAWFERFELGERRYVIQSPELRAFQVDLQRTGAVLQCSFPAAGTPAAPTCDGALQAELAGVARLVQRSLQP